MIYIIDTLNIEKNQHSIRAIQGLLEFNWVLLCCPPEGWQEVTHGLSDEDMANLIYNHGPTDVRGIISSLELPVDMPKTSFKKITDYVKLLVEYEMVCVFPLIQAQMQFEDAVIAGDLDDVD